jgi:cystine transport system substrate-binding protein
MKNASIRLLVAAAAAASLVSSCSRKQASSGDLLVDIRARGELRVAMEGQYSPWTYHDPKTDELVGFDVELTRAVAAKLGVKAVFHEVAWDGIFAGIDAGRWDIAANEVAITPERAEKYAFSVPYAKERTAVLVRKDYDAIRAPEDLKGKKTANSITSTQNEVAVKYGAIPSNVESFTDTVQLLLAGRIDATLHTDTSFYDYLRANPDANVKIACYVPGEEDIAIAMPKGDAAASLKTAIDAAVTELLADGTIAEISRKYIGADLTK